MRVARIATLGVLIWLGVASSGFGNQDPLERVKSLYLAAEYESALAALDALPEGSGGIAAATYRMQCLIALDRTREAQAAIESIVRADPAYRPSEAEVSPRILALFVAARRALLPAAVQSMFAGAKAAFERGSPDALARFDSLLELLDDPDVAGLPVSADVRMLATGFRDLAVARSAAPAASAPASSPAPVSVRSAAASNEPPATAASAITPPAKSAASSTKPPAAAPPVKFTQASMEPPRTAPPIKSAETSTEPPAIAPPAAAVAVEGEPGIIPPVTINQVLPKWQPGWQGDARRGYEGTLELVIDARGAVESARLQGPIHPQFRAALLRAVREWSYEPATKDGAPIRYLKVMKIQLQPLAPDRR